MDTAETIAFIKSAKARKPPKELGDQERRRWLDREHRQMKDFHSVARELARAVDLPSPARRGHFLRDFGQSDRDVIENASSSASVPQALNLLNSPLPIAIHNRNSVLGSQLEAAPTPEEKIAIVYRAMLTREPTDRETTRILADYEQYGDETLEDLVWALLNSRQFLFIPPIRHPGLGAWGQRIHGKLNPTMPGSGFIGKESRFHGSGGFFEPAFEPLTISEPRDGLKYSRRKVQPERFNRQMRLANDLDIEFLERYGPKSVRAYGDMYEDAVVVLTTEFGRTSIPNQNNGRDHYPKAFTSVLAGGGFKGGYVYGQTSKGAEEVDENPVTIPDFNATITHALGIPIKKELISPTGRPFTVAHKGEPVQDLFA